MGHGQGSQKTRLRRLKSIELLTKSLESLAGGAWLPLSEHTSAEAQINRTSYEFIRIRCQRGMASALRRRVCGGSNQ